MTESPIEVAFLVEWPRVVGALVWRTCDWDLADDCAQEAFAEAVRRWPTEADLRRRRGDRTGAATAYRRAIDLAPSDIERRYPQRRLDQVSPR